MEECLAIMNSLNSRFGDDFLPSLDFSLLKGAFASILFEMFLKQTFFFLREVLGSQQNWQKVLRFPTYSIPGPHKHMPSFFINTPHQNSTLVTVHEPIVQTGHYHPKLVDYLRDSLLVLYLLWVWKSI